MAMRPEFEALLAIGGIHEKGLPIFAEAYGPIPQQVTDPG